VIAVIDDKRICEVYAEPERPGEWQCGSGYLVSGRLVLTAGHVTGPAGGAVQVRCLGTGPGLFAGRVVWRQYDPDAELDEALLELNDPRWVRPDGLAAVRWGWLVTSAAEASCEAAGFPRARVRRSADGTLLLRDLAQVTGSINPLDGSKRGILQVSVTSATPDPAGPGASQWGGMSGAAVLCGPLLTGIVIHDADRYGGKLLDVVPAQRLLRSPSFSALLAADLGEAPAIEPAELEPFVSSRLPPRTPAALLRADVEAVGFRGREELMDQLESWCLTPGGYSVRLLTGAGGQGKTRLACELGRRLAARSWAVLRLAPAPADPSPDYRVLGALRVPVLVIVDYAEARAGQVGAVVNELARGSAPARLLLLARTAGEWQNELVKASPALDVAVPGSPVEIVLPALADDDATRAAMFDAAAADLSARLGTLTGHEGVDWPRALAAVTRPDLSSTRYETALAVQMAALAALLTSGHGDTIPGGRAEDVLLGHEGAYWDRLAAGPGGPGDPGLVGRPTLPDAPRMHRWLVAAASLCTAADEDEAVQTLARLPGLTALGGNDTGLAVAHWLHYLYPERNLYVGSLQPDVLAEHLIGTVLADKPTVFDAVLTGGSADQVHHGLTVLARAAATRPPVAAVIERVIGAWPAALAPAAARVASETENPAPLTRALDDLLAAGAADPDLLEAVDDEIPAHSEVHRDRAERIAARLVDLRRQQDRAQRRAHPVRSVLRPGADTLQRRDLAQALYRYAHSLGEVGRAEESLAAFQEAIAILRRLAKTDPTAVITLASAVNDMSMALAALGRYREAMAASDEAVAGMRDAAVEDQDERDYLSVIAGLTLGKSLMELGRLEEALASTETAVARLRTLPDGLGRQRGLAIGVTNLTGILAFLGRFDEAEIAAKEAVGILRELAGSLPDQFLANLAVALINSSRASADAGALPAALAAAAEAVSILRPLSEGHLDVFGSFLAMALMNQGVLAKLARPGDGLAALEEAVVLGRHLAAARPAAHNPQLVMALVDLAAVETDLNHTDRALRFSAEALALAQKLAQDNPVAYEPTLLLALDARAGVLDVSGEAELAIAGAREAVAVWRRLAGQRPTAYEPRLAGALSRLAQVLDSLGQAPEAYQTATEAVALSRRIGPGRDSVLGLAVATLSQVLTSLDRHEQAMAASVEAVAIYRGLAKANPGAHHAELAAALSYLRADLAELGRPREALEAARESVELYRSLAASQPGVFESELADELAAVVRQLGRLDRTAEAADRAREVVELRRAIAADGTADHLARLARSLSTWSFWLGKADQRAQALAVEQEATDVFRGLARADAGRYRAEVATSLTGLADSYAAAGDFTAASAALEEAIPLLRDLARADPDKQRAPLATALKELGAYVSELGRHQEALAAADDARALLADLARAGVDDYRQDRLAVLRIITGSLLGLNRLDEALSSADETIAIAGTAGQSRQQSRQSDGQSGQPEGQPGADVTLATAIRLRGLVLAGLGRTEEAIAATREATSMLRAVTAGSDGDRPRTLELALCLQNLGKYLSETGQHEEARTATTEALALFREANGEGTGPLEPYIALCLTNLSMHNIGLEQWDQAAASAREAVAMSRRLAATGADTYTAGLAMALRNLGVSEAGAGHGPRAIAALRESVALYERLGSDQLGASTADALAHARGQLSKTLDEFE
jgi:tetratricopeptide (TPR) repeat protein